MKSRQGEMTQNERKKKIKKREKPLDSDVKTQQQQKITKTTRKTNFPSITRLKAVIVPGLRPLVQRNR